MKNSPKMERDWRDWDDKPRTVEEHIEVYRENLVKLKEPETVNEVESIDLFAVRDWKLFSDEFLMICYLLLS